MATTITAALVGSTQYMLKYKLTSSGAGTGKLIAGVGGQANLKADAKKDAPLYGVLTAVYTNTAAAQAVLASGKMEVFMQPGGVAGGNWVIFADESAGVFEIDVATSNTETIGAYLYIKYRHSVAR